MVVESNPEYAPAGWKEILTRQYGASLALVCLGVWLHAADSLLVATMLPAIIDEIGGRELVAWVVALYEIGSIVAGAAGGLLAVRHGLRMPMVGAALLFAFGCCISAVAPTMWVVLAGRLLQGLGGGGLMALSFVAVGLLFPQRFMARAMAAVSTLWGVSAFLGPLVGGFFVEFATWRGGFWFFALQALILTAWILAGTALERGSASRAIVERLPLLRLVLLSAGVVLVAYAGIEISLLRTALFILAGIAALAVFLRLDSTSTASRLLPRSALGLDTPAGAALLMVLTFSMATIAITAYGPLFMTTLHGASALLAGYIIACESIAWTVAAVLVSGAPERSDPKFIAAGMLVVTAGIAGLVYSIPNGPLWFIVICSVLEGAGFGMAWTFILRRATSAAPSEDIERISGAIPTIQRLGYALGAAYVGIVANAAGFAHAVQPGETAHAARMLFLACLLPAIVGLIAMTRFVAADVRHGRE